MKYRFDSQTKLKKAKNIMSEDYLKIEDQSLDAYLKSLMNSINEKANEWQNSRFNQLFKTETSLIASLYNFPYKIEQVYDILSKVPKAVMANKHIYEQIFSLLQIHTCYIKEMFTVSKLLDFYLGEWRIEQRWAFVFNNQFNLQTKIWQLKLTEEYLCYFKHNSPYCSL